MLETLKAIDVFMAYVLFLVSAITLMLSYLLRPTKPDLAAESIVGLLAASFFLLAYKVTN